MAKILNINEKKILFVHIPKNAGRAIESCFSSFISGMIGGHPDLKQISDIWGLKILEEVDCIFYTKRDIYERAASIYNYFRNTTPSLTGHRLENEYFNNNDFETSMKFLCEKKNKKEGLTKSRYGSTYSEIAIKNQKDYVDTSFIENSVLRNKVDKKIFRIEVENLEDDIQDFLVFLKIREKEMKQLKKHLANAKISTSSIKTKKNKFSKKESVLVETIYDKDVVWVDGTFHKIPRNK